MILEKNSRDCPLIFIHAFTMRMENSKFTELIFSNKMILKMSLSIVLRYSLSKLIIKTPLILLSAVEATSFALCITDIFSLSRRLSSIRELNLRGFISMSKD